MPSTGNPERSCENGKAVTPLIGAGSIATAATAWFFAISSCAMSPPKEWPTTMGLAAMPAIREA